MILTNAKYQLFGLAFKSKSLLFKFNYFITLFISLTLSQNMKKTTSLIITLLITFSFSFAQEEPDEEVFEMSLEELMNIEVVTASQSKQKATDAPATIHVITAEQIWDRGYQNLEELLEDIPEIEIQQKSVAEFSNHISLRGIAGNEKFMILQDGIRINSMAGTPHAVKANYSLANAKRVEIILGPASALYGVDAFSGIINIITRTGEEVDGTELNLSYGSFGTTEDALVLGYGNEDFSFNLTGSYYYSDEPFMPDYYEEEYSWYTDQYSQNGDMRLAPFAPNVIVPTGTPQEYETPTESYYIDAGINIKDFEFGYTRNQEQHNSSVGMQPDYNIYAKEALFRIILESAYAIHDYNPDDKKWSIRSKISLGSYELSPESEFLNTFTSYRPGFKYAFHRAFTLTERFSYTINSNSSIIGGFSFQDITALPKSGDLPTKFDKDVPSDLQNLYYLGTNTTDNAGNDLTIFQDFYYIEQRNFGFFAQYQNKFSDLINMTLGLRYDLNTRYESSINPRAGLVISPSDQLKFKVLYGEAFLAPSVYKAFQHFGSFITVDGAGDPTSDPNQTTGLGGPFWHLTNPDLQPEKVRTGEIGGSFIKGDFGVSFDVYYNHLEQLIGRTVEFNQTFKGIPIDAVERPINQGNAETYGFTVKFDGYHKLGGLTIQEYAAYSYSDGEIDGAHLPFSAQHTIKAGVMAKIGNFSFNPRLIYRTESLHPTRVDTNGDPESNDSFALVNFFSRYELNDKVSFYLKIRNLLDQRFYNVSLAQDEGFAATPQDPIRIMGGVQFKF